MTKKDKVKKTNGDKKQRNKTPWKEKQMTRLEKTLKSSKKLYETMFAAKAPNVDASHAEIALTRITALHSIGARPRSVAARSPRLSAR